MVHLGLNHFPLILGVSGTGATLVGVTLRRDALVRYGAASLLLGGLFAPLTYLSGQLAAQALEHTRGISHAAIEAHEEIALWGLLSLLAAAGVAAAWLRRPSRKWALMLAVIGMLSAAVLVRVGWQGGKIVHGSAASATRLRRP